MALYPDVVRYWNLTLSGATPFGHTVDYTCKPGMRFRRTNVWGQLEYYDKVTIECLWNQVRTARASIVS